MKQDHQLPNGKRTTSADRYLREWRKLTAPFAKAFNLECIGCDPSALFQSNGGGWSIDVPVSMLTHFNDNILPYLPENPKS